MLLLIKNVLSLCIVDVTKTSNTEDRKFEITPNQQHDGNVAPIQNPSFSSANLTSVSSAMTPNNFKKLKFTDDELVTSNDNSTYFESVLQRNKTECNPSPAFAGFTTAGGKQIAVSAAAMSKKTNIFDGVEVSADDLKSMDTWMDCNERSNSTILQQRNPISNMPAFNGFTTARGHKIAVSPATISKKIDIFRDVDVTTDEMRNLIAADMGPSCERNINNSLDFEFNENATFASFSTARGARIPTSSALISKKRNIFENVEVSADDLKKMNNWIHESERIDPAVVAGFTTARGQQISVSPATISKQINIFRNVEVTGDELKNTCDWIGDIDPSGEHNTGDSKRINLNLNASPAFAGFTTARGNHIPVSSTMISKQTNIFENLKVTADELSKMNNWINDVQPNTSDTSEISFNPNSWPLFSEPVKNVIELTPKQSNSSELFREVTNITQRDGKTDTAPRKLPVDTLFRPSPMRRMSMVNSLRKMGRLKENVDTKLSPCVNESASNAVSESPTHVTTSIMNTPTSSRAYIYKTPINNPKTYTQEGRDSAAAILQDDEFYQPTPSYVTGFMTQLIASSTPIQKVDGNRPKQRRLVETFDDIADEDFFESMTPLDTVKVQVPPHIKSLRKSTFAEQLKSVTKKTNIKPVPSSLYIKKLTSSKVEWKEFVDNSRPLNRLVSDTKLTDCVLNVRVETATKFKFNAWDFYSDEFCRENTDGIHLPDDIVVMMDDNCQIGLNEISAAFLSCPSVDPNLMHKKWIENSMKWIVVKLAAMERSFPTRFAGQALTLENLMLQMKYRYEREIDRAERSAIRKICETDDIPAKRMILFVAEITGDRFNRELELSDGWYSLMSTLDHQMVQFVNDGKIKIGTKLVIQGARIVDLEHGCHPLDVGFSFFFRFIRNSS